MTSNVIRLRGDQVDVAAAAEVALDRLLAHLDRAALSAHTVTAYRRRATAYTAWLATNPDLHPDAFTDTIGAEAAVAAWRKQLLVDGAGPSTVNQALAAVTLLYEQGAALRIKAKRARIPRPGEPDALTKPEQGKVTRAADRRGPRDAAVIALLLGSGARAEECARLAVTDVPITPRTGTVRLLGKGDQVRTVPLPAPARERVSTWLRIRTELLAARPALAARVGDGLWVGQRGRLSVDGITDVVLAVGRDAGLPGLRPHRLRHTYATRLREDGADPAQVQRLLGHASLDTTAVYFRAGEAEVAALVEHALDQ